MDDDSNGLAYFFDNKIEIWARPLDYDLRGSHRWMQDVITHEFVHIVQLATAMKFTSRVPSLYFQVIDYEDEKREDVLYGYPNVIASYAYPGVNIPPWFAEGVAQYMYPGANYDFWDTHRDMIVRDRVLNGNLLSLVAMNTFGKRGIGNESAYNQGFSFVSYLSDRFGVQVLEKISRRMSAPLSISISRAMKKATGSDGRQLYREWKGQLESRYDHEMTNVLAHRVTGDILVDKGTTNLHPVWHPSERKFAFLSNRAADFFGQTDLYIYNMKTTDLDPIATSAISAPSWSPDGRYLAFVGTWCQPEGGFDVTVLDTQTDTLRTVSPPGLDVSSVSFSPTDGKIAFHTIQIEPFIYTVRPDGSQLQRHSTSDNSTEESNWSPDGRYIAFTSPGLDHGICD